MTTIILLIVLGLALGSFVNALVWRIHQQESKQGGSKDLSILRGRSMCPHCKHSLSLLDLIPVVSWLMLRGKCRYCKKSISLQYPIVEITTALAFVVSYFTLWQDISVTWQYINFATWLMVLTGLIALFVYDVKWMILPDRIVFTLMSLLGVSYAVQFVLGRPLGDIAGILLSAVIGGGVFYGIYQASKGKWIGGGDVKLGLLLGLVVAKPELSLLFLSLASIIGLIVVAPMLATKKLGMTSKVPFGPFLITGAFLAVTIGTQLIDWYAGLVVY